MPEFLSFRAEVWNAFETELLETVSTACTSKEISNGQFEIVSRAHFKNRKVGVYQIVFTVLYGETEYRKIKHAFEVFDPDSGLCPPLESGQSIVYECARESGVPSGFGIRTDALNTVTGRDCDVLVLPSLASMEESVLQEIRRLYREGVNLIAVSDVSGLEELFGVEKHAVECAFESVEYQGKTEYVYNTKGTLSYQPTAGRTVVTVNETLPAVIATDRTVLINAAMRNFGCADKTKMGDSKGCFVVGKLIRKAITQLVKTLSDPCAVGDGVGITLFEDEHGKRMLLAIDYSPFDNQERTAHEVSVRLFMPDVYNVKSEQEIKSVKVDGIVRELRFDILPHGFCFVELE